MRLEKAIAVMGEKIFWIICGVTILYFGGHLIAWAIRAYNSDQIHIQIIGN